MADRRIAGGHQVDAPPAFTGRLYERRTALSRACGVFFLVGVASFPGCGTAPPDSSAQPIVLRIGVPEANVSSPEMGLPQIVRYFNVEGLIAKADDGRPLPRLAKSWSPSSDGLTWHFSLRDDVEFHDGTRFDAIVARDSLLESVGHPSTKALYPGLIDVTEIEAAGEHELTIKLRRRSAFLIDDLDFPITRPAQPKQRIGTGAFKVVTDTPDEVVLEPHADYYGGRPQIDRVVIRPYPALRAAWASMMRQEMDVLWDVAQDSAEFVGSDDVRLYSYLRPYVSVIAFNSGTRNLARAPVRRALNAAVDRTALLRDVLKDRGVAASGPLWPRHWAYDSTLTGYAFDASLAATTLDAAGLQHPLGTRGLQSRFRFRCLVPENFAILERLALTVQKQLYDVGVDMQLEPVSTEEYVRRISRSEFEAVIIEMISGPVYTRAYSFWRWGGESTGYNVFGYRNSAADKWFDSLRHAANEAEYRAAVGQLQRVLLEDPPGLFLAWHERTRVISRRFNVASPPDTDPIPFMWQWTLHSDTRPSTP